MVSILAEIDDKQLLLSKQSTREGEAMKRILALTLVLVFGFASGVSAQGSEQALLDVMQKTYAEMTSMRCEFEQTLVHRESGSKTTRPGVLQFKKPLLVHWEVTGKDHEILVVTKSDVWNYLPDEEVAYRYNLDVIDDSNSFLKVVTGQANLREDFEIASEGPAKAGGVNLIEYHLYPFNPTQQLTEAYLWLEPGTGVIKRVRIYDFFGNENDITFKTNDLKANLADKLFAFSPLQGVDVEDHFDTDAVPESTLFQ